MGDVKGADCIIVDDMIDTAGTLCAAANELIAFGARRVFAFATHGLFNGQAAPRGMHPPPPPAHTHHAPPTPTMHAPCMHRAGKD